MVWYDGYATYMYYVFSDMKRSIVIDMVRIQEFYKHNAFRYFRAQGDRNIRINTITTWTDPNDAKKFIQM
jgi:hypothetical protein